MLLWALLPFSNNFFPLIKPFWTFFLQWHLWCTGSNDKKYMCVNWGAMWGVVPQCEKNVQGISPCRESGNPKLDCGQRNGWLSVSHVCVCQLCGAPARGNMESRRMPFTEQIHNTPSSASTTLLPPSTTIVASCANTANVNMDGSQFSVGPYDDFAVRTLQIRCDTQSTGVLFQMVMGGRLSLGMHMHCSNGMHPLAKAPHIAVAVMIHNGSPVSLTLCS